MTEPSPLRVSAVPVGLVVACLIILAGEMWTFSAGESQTYDEAAHLYSGYVGWTNFDFGSDPQHPPFAKLVAASPLLFMHLTRQPVSVEGNSLIQAFTDGANLLYSNDADKVLFRARLATSVFAFLLALLVFFAGREIAGFGAGLCALILLIFEPNIVGNGAVVDTDVAAACCIFGAIYSLYRYIKYSTPGRLAICGVTAGIALSAKFSAVLIEPIFLFLILCECWTRSKDGDDSAGAIRWKQQAGVFLKWMARFAFINFVAITVVWSSYGFRYRARPTGKELTPPFNTFVKNVSSPAVKSTIEALADWHILPESYVYGLATIANNTQVGRAMYLFGKRYPTGQWFYFPIVLLIKPTLGFLGLLVLSGFGWQFWNKWPWRETLFAVVPPLVYFNFCVFSKLDLGIRHLLPVLPFLILIAGSGAAALARRSRQWTIAVSALLCLHAGSSLYAYPGYLAYSNEAWGGTSQTYRWLGDSNVGWSGGLKEVARYVRERHISHCWISAGGTVDPRYYGIPCHAVPTGGLTFLNEPPPPVPSEIDGTVFVGDLQFTYQSSPWTDSGPIHPVANLSGEFLVLEGHFSIPKLAARSHLQQSTYLAKKQELSEALAEAKTAASIDKESLAAQTACGALLTKLHQNAEAQEHYRAALTLARAQNAPATQIAALEKASK